MRRERYALATVFLLAGIGAGSAEEFRPTRQVLPDSATAITVGCAILHSYFPQWEGRKASPGCGVTSSNTDRWTIYEKLAGGAGGSPEVELSKTDGRVLRIYMTQ